MLAAASTASASTDGSEAVITDDELAACIGVLRRLCTAAEGDAAAKPSEAFYTPRLKPLRLALLPLIEDFRSTTGADRIDKIRAGKEKQRERHRREQQQKALDRAATDKTRMRRERLEMLGALESADAPRVPDGAVGMVDGLLLEHRQTGGDSTAPLALPPPGEASGSGEPEARLREAGAEEATEEGASDRGSGLLARGRGEADGEGELLHLRACYICKVRYRRLHHLYGSLCPGCAALNEAKRLQTADLRGRVVLLTGARVKIGFQAALKLLRCGARVLATTRFPVDAAARFAALPDFDRWSANLQIFGLDLRDLEALERFCDFLDATEAHLSDIVNNACQTIRRPAQYYRHLIEKELAPHEAPADHRRCLALHEACFGAAAALAAPASKQLLAPLAAPPQRSQGELSQGVPQGGRLVGAPADGAGSAAPAAAVPSALWSQLPVWGAPADGGEAGEAGEAGGEEAAALFPAGAHDVNGQQLDLRTTNSWLLRLGQVRTGEVAEVLAINTLAPFILNSRLRALLQRSPVAARQVVNVSAMEGKFYRYKTANHPHTNMAKAALNMMTRTCAEELAANGVYMNSIDTGWINDENPLQRAARTAEKHHFQTPLDEVDAAARILDPILSAANGEPPVYGRFVKDYQPCEW